MTAMTSVQQMQSSSSPSPSPAGSATSGGGGGHVGLSSPGRPGSAASSPSSSASASSGLNNGSTSPTVGLNLTTSNNNNSSNNKDNNNSSGGSANNTPSCSPSAASPSSLSGPSSNGGDRPTGPSSSPLQLNSTPAHHNSLASLVTSATSATSPHHTPNMSSLNTTPSLNMTSAHSNSASSHHVSSHTTTGSTRPLRLRRVNHSDEIINGFGKLLKSESLTDVTISCSGGLNIRAHRVILSTFSPYFRAIFESAPFVDTPWTYPVIVMKDYGFPELKAIVEFIYKGEVSVPRDRLASVLQTAKALEVSGLADLKPEAFGVNNISSVTGSSSNSSSNQTSSTHPHSSSSPLVNGHNSSSSTFGSSGHKRQHLGSCNEHLNDSLQHSTRDSADLSSASSSLAKKLRLLEHQQQQQQNSSHGSGSSSAEAINSSAAALSSLSALTQYAAASGIDLNSLEGVRSLLQQPPRLPSVIQQLRQQQQQAQLQQLATLAAQRSSGTASTASPSATATATSPPTRMSNISLQQIINQQKAAVAAASIQPSGQTAGANRLNPRHLQMQQQQNQLKQQILQQQLLRSKNYPNANAHLQQQQNLHRTSSVGSAGSGVPFLQFQQRIRQQIQEKQRANQMTTLGQLISKPLLQKQLTSFNQNKIKSEHGNGANHDSDDDEVEVIIKESESPEKNNGDNGTGNGISSGDSHRDEDEDMKDDDEQQRMVNGKKNGENEESSENLMIGEDEDHLPQDSENGADDEEYEIEIDKDAIFQQQQQMRLQQIQKQQQNYQLQLLQEQEEQEQRLLEYHQSLSQASGGGGNSEADDGDVENNQGSPGFGFDWQEGFTDDLPYGKSENGMSDSSSPISHLNRSSNHHSGPVATPDFLQPRGPGRPRKGNKAQEISPCPECNKVFVRPDVLKLHYRSVHLNERHPCNLCPKIFKWPGDLSKHKRTKHPDKHPPANLNNHSQGILGMNH